MALKRRVIAQFLLQDGILFRTRRFIPDYRYTVSWLGAEAADEICIVDLGGDRGRFYAAASGLAARALTPVTIGGKVKNLEEVGYLMREVGADKVLIKGHRTALIHAISLKYGANAVVAGVDYKPGEEDDALDEAMAAQDAGAGELLVTSVDRDGSLNGFDLDFLQRVVRVATIPVVVSGGCNGWRDMGSAFECGASGAATSNIHHISEASLANFKTQLVKAGAPVRP